MNESDSYCRDVEAYLCRKNEGHLIRIVGPAFELVQGWAALGVPLKVACAGIDCYFERYYRRGPRKRPLRIEFCEADVLDAFDQWKRSVGLAATGSAASETASAVEGGDEADGERHRPGARRGPSLAAHVEQVVARLTLLRSSAGAGLLADDALAEAVSALDGLHADAKRARGEARDALIARLASVEDRVLARATAALGATERHRLESEAEHELAPFRARMPTEAYVRSRQAALTRLVRERFLLPRIAYE